MPRPDCLQGQSAVIICRVEQICNVGGEDTNPPVKRVHEDIDPPAGPIAVGLDLDMRQIPQRKEAAQ